MVEILPTRTSDLSRQPVSNLQLLFILLFFIFISMLFWGGPLRGAVVIVRGLIHKALVRGPGP